MLLRLTPIALLSSLVLAQSPEIYSNGPLKTGVSGTNDISALQNVAPLNFTVFGYGHAGAISLVDQFAVNTTMILDGIEVFGYLTGATTTTCTAVQIALYDGNPNGGTPTQLLPGAGMGVNLTVDPTGLPTTTAGYTTVNSFTNLYRVLVGTPTATNRRLQSVKIDFAPIVLPAGIYYLQYNTTGISFCPPLTTLNQGHTGDAMQFNGTAWTSPITQGSGPFPQGIPFKLYGTAVTPPGSITNLGGGCNSVTFDVQGSPAVGGYILAELGAVNALTFGAIIASLAQPIPGGLPLLCGCTLHVNPDVVDIGGGLGLGLSKQIIIPANAALVGADLYLQGAQLDLIPAAGLLCNLGIAFDLTAGYRVHLY